MLPAYESDLIPSSTRVGAYVTKPSLTCSGDGGSGSGITILRPPAVSTLRDRVHVSPLSQPPRRPTSKSSGGTLDGVDGRVVGLGHDDRDVHLGPAQPLLDRVFGREEHHRAVAAELTRLAESLARGLHYR